jgi:integrase/recombinase XerD
MDDKGQPSRTVVDAQLPVLTEPTPLVVVEFEGETPWRSVVEAFLNAAVDSPHTRAAYALQLRRAFAALGVRSVAELTGAKLAAYRARVCAMDEYAPATKAQMLHALRSFLRWSGALGAHPLSGDTVRLALRVPRTKVKTPRNILNEVQAAALLAAAAATPRDWAMMCVFVGAGLRISEVSRLDCRDLRSDGAGGFLLHIRQGKGRVDRLVPVHGEVHHALLDYLATTQRHPSSEGALFRRYDGRHNRGGFYRGAPRDRLSRQAIFRHVKRLLTEASINAKGYSPHSLRHTYAMRAFRARASAVHVQKLLGHASLMTTQVYLDHLQLPELLAAVPPLPLDGAPPAARAPGGRKPKR